MENTDITIFTYNNRQIRTVTGPDGEPWFVAADIAKTLGYRIAPDMVRSLDEDEKGTQIVRTPGGPQQMTIISEAGLYSAIMRSRVEDARAFKRWVTHDVLPSIRKRGGYLTPEAAERALTDPDFIIQLATALKEERARRQAIEADHKALTAQVEADAPHTRFGRTISGTDGDLLVKQVADLITQGGRPISQVTLFKWLRRHGWLCSNQGRLWNAPTKWALDKGYVRSAVTVISTGRGCLEKTTPHITALGQENLIDGWLTGRYTDDEEAGQ